MTTYAELQTKVSRDLSDPDRQTFNVDAIKDFIQQGLAEIARIAPRQFKEDLTPVADQLEYDLLTDDFTDPIQEVRVVRVEVWTGVPSRFKAKVKSKAGAPSRDSKSGWEVWGGVLELPQHVVDGVISVDDDTIRVWGYAPFAPISADADVVPLSAELELALREFCRVQSMRKLVASRVLFKQWQTRSNNTDVTIGALNADLQIAEEGWRKMKRELKVPEQNPD